MQSIKNMLNRGQHTSVHSHEEELVKLKEQVKALEHLLETTEKLPITVNLTTREMDTALAKQGVVEPKSEYSSGLMDILEFDEVKTVAEAHNRAKRLYGLILDIGPGIEDDRGVRYLIEGPAWFIAAVNQAVPTNARLVTFFECGEEGCELIEVNQQ